MGSLNQASGCSLKDKGVCPFRTPKPPGNCRLPPMTQLQLHYISNGHASPLDLWEVILGGGWAQLFLQLLGPDDRDPEVPKPFPSRTKSLPRRHSYSHSRARGSKFLRTSSSALVFTPRSPEMLTTSLLIALTPPKIHYLCSFILLLSAGSMITPGEMVAHRGAFAEHEE